MLRIYQSFNSIESYIINKKAKENFIARGGARPGAGRPTLYPRTIRASIRLSEDEVRMIEECIEKLGTNRSDIISKEIKEIYKKTIG